MEVLKSFLTRKPMNVLFPFSVTGATIGVVLLIGGASGAESDSARTGLTLLAALMGLALLEHWCLVLPLPFDRLWAWAKPRLDAASDPSEDGLDHLDFAPVRVQLSRRFDARSC
jgi:hypothetical protein